MQMAQHDDRIDSNFVSVWQSSKQVTPMCRFSPPVGTVLSQKCCVAFINAFIKLYSQNRLKTCIQHREDFCRAVFLPAHFPSTPIKAHQIVRF
jgi:hypothetical protein